MKVRHQLVAVGLGIGLTVLLGGCASERSMVSFNYVVQPERGLPPGMNTIYVAPAKVGSATDPKWSELSATLVQQLVNESRNEFGTNVRLADRRDTQVTFDEADLKASGMSTEKGGKPGQLLGAQGAIVSNIDVKVEKHEGSDRTITGIDFNAFRGETYHGDHYGGGGGAIQTGEVETVTRHMTVQANFRLLDTANNQVWEQHTGSHSATDKTDASPFFGKSMTEAELTPQDRIIGTLVERAAREFISKLMPVRVVVSTDVKSSGNKSCAEGVRLLRGEVYDQALVQFKTALSESPNDHRAAFGAGVAAEALGRFNEALGFYQQACTGAQQSDYMEARDRVKAYAGRAHLAKR